MQDLIRKIFVFVRLRQTVSSEKKWQSIFFLLASWVFGSTPIYACPIAQMNVFGLARETLQSRGTVVTNVTELSAYVTIRLC